MNNATLEFTWVRYGSVLDNLGRTEEALEAYAEAINLSPDSARLYRNRAEILIHARRLLEAEADLAHAVRLDGNRKSPYLWYRYAQIAIARGDGSLADHMLDEVQGVKLIWQLARLNWDESGRHR